MSAHELNTARRLGASYVVHFWGEVSLGRPIIEEYALLRAKGYPLYFRNPAVLLNDGILVAEAASWRIVRGGVSHS